MWNRFKTLDPWLFVIPLMLMILSVTIIYALTLVSQGAGLALRQGIFAGIGLILMVAMAFIDYRGLKAWSVWIYGAGMVALAAVPIFGTAQFGAKLWIQFGFFQFEPGEIWKLVLMVTIAAMLTRERGVLPARRFFIIAVLGLLPIVAVLIEPDLGTSLVLISILVTMLLHSRLQRWQRVLIIAALFLGVGIMLLSLQSHGPFSHLLKPYQKDRLVSFIQPQRDPSGSGYNVKQSVIAVGSGGLFGQGLGNGNQAQLNFLPVAHTDFIFATAAEAWGLVGSWGVLFLYGVLIYRILQAARIAKDDFGALICVGFIAKITFEILVNAGMNMRLMPVTGIPLPFLSYGGTTMLTNALAVGLVQSVVIRYKRLTF